MGWTLGPPWAVVSKLLLEPGQALALPRCLGCTPAQKPAAWVLTWLPAASASSRHSQGVSFCVSNMHYLIHLQELWVTPGADAREGGPQSQAVKGITVLPVSDIPLSR